jgi:hypothetical protein
MAAITTSATPANRETTTSRVTALPRPTARAVTLSRRSGRCLTRAVRHTYTFGSSRRLAHRSPLDGDPVLGNSPKGTLTLLSMSLAPAAGREAGALAGTFDFVLR